MAFFGGADQSLQIVIKARDEASKVLTGMTSKMKKTAKDMKGIGVGMSAVGVGIGAMSYNFIKVASDAEETQSKFNVVFRGMEKEMNDWAESFGKDTGRARQDIKAWSSGMADVLKPMGLTTEEAGKMSKEMVQLALDVASFNNKQDADVIHAFNSALTGERESLKTLGIVINEADVKQEAYASGLAEVGEELSKEAKAQATVNLLFKNTKDAQGDLMRTQDSFANQTKMVRSQLKDLSETIGNELLPIVTPMVAKISEATTKFAEWAEKNKELTQKIIIGIAAFGALMLVLGPLLLILPGIVTAVILLAKAVVVVTAKAFLLKAALIGLPLVIVGKIIYKVIKALYEFGKEVGGMGNAWSLTILEMEQSVIKFAIKTVEMFNVVGQHIPWLSTQIGNALDYLRTELESSTVMFDAYAASVHTSAQATSENTDELNALQEELNNTTSNLLDLDDTTTDTSKTIDKVTTAFGKYTDSIRDIAEKTKDAIGDITKEISGLQKKLTDLTRDYTKDQTGFRRQYAQAYLDQEQKVADAQADFNTAKEKDAKEKALSKLQAEQEALAKYVSYEQTYHAEIEYLRAEAQKSEFERTLDSIKKAQWKAVRIYTEKKKEILDEIKLEEEKLTAIKKIQAITLLEHDKFLANQELHTVDSINRQIGKYNELAKAISRAMAGKTSGFVGQAPGTIERATQEIPAMNKAGLTVNINNPIVRDDSDIDKMKDMMDDYFRTVMVNNKITA